MKTIFLTVLVCFLSVQISQAQWQPDVRLTNNPALSLTNGYTNARCIASSGDTVHVVWYDTRDGASPEIYYKRSTDGGLNWGSDTRISNNLYFSSNPSVSISGSFIHVVWDDNRDGNYEIYYNRSTDGGTSWGTDTRLTNDSAASQNPCISTSGSVVNAVWTDNRDGFHAEVYYKRSTDEGLSWGADIRLTNDLAGSWGASVSASGLLVHVLWLDSRNAYQNVFYNRSTDGGLNWGTDTQLTNNDSTRLANNPSVAVSGSNVHVIWMESPRETFAYEMYYKHSTDGGITWGAGTQLTTNYSSATLFSTLSVSGQDVHVVWDDNRDGNYEIYYKHSTDGGISWGTDIRLTDNPSASVYPFVSASGSGVHVLWTDNRDGNYEIYYKRDPTGNVTGIENIGLKLPEDFSLAQNYPNPFNPVTNIRYAILQPGNVTLKVYDILGNEVAVLVDEYNPAGNYKVEFQSAAGGSVGSFQLASGIYFYRLQAGSFIETKKMILLK
jgi:hypothetical protein